MRAVTSLPTAINPLAEEAKPNEPASDCSEGAIAWDFGHEPDRIDEQVNARRDECTQRQKRHCFVEDAQKDDDELFDGGIHLSIVAHVAGEPSVE
jgi:hypothetical protein